MSEQTTAQGIVAAIGFGYYCRKNKIDPDSLTEDETNNILIDLTTNEEKRKVMLDGLSLSYYPPTIDK